jgi:septum formation protein
MKKPRLILASASPQRKKLLRKLRVPFDIIPSHAPETNPATVNHRQARKLVTDLAERKARAIARKFKKDDCVVLGADTLVVCNGKIFGKPRNEAHARSMLRQLSGNWQTVVTGLCVIRNPGGRIRKGFAATRLRFRTIPEPVLNRLAHKNLDKSGAYAIQNIHDRWLAEIRGDLDNVIGLPLRVVRRLLA